MHIFVIKELIGWDVSSDIHNIIIIKISIVDITIHITLYLK